MHGTSGELPVRRVARLAREMGIRLSIVSGMLILEGRETLVIQPVFRTDEGWRQLDDLQLYELLYSRSYRRRSTDYGKRKPIISKSSTREEIYTDWDSLEG